MIIFKVMYLLTYMYAMFLFIFMLMFMFMFHEQDINIKIDMGTDVYMKMDTERVLTRIWAWARTWRQMSGSEYFKAN
jgi:hypothetical protein